MRSSNLFSFEEKPKNIQPVDQPKWLICQVEVTNLSPERIERLRAALAFECYDATDGYKEAETMIMPSPIIK